MNRNDQALRLLNDIWADFHGPDFVWQLSALLACLAVAFLLARHWQGRHAEGAGRLGDASSRLAFPLSGLLLVGLARLLLAPFIQVNLLKLALPLLASMALVRAVVFVLRHAFPLATWLATWERIIATVVWGCLALYITDLAPFAISSLEQVQFSLGKQRFDLWLVLHGVVTVFLIVVFALWIAGLVERRLLGIANLDSSLRMVGIRVAPSSSCRTRR